MLFCHGRLRRNRKKAESKLGRVSEVGLGAVASW
jgi:hypothetical protein